MTMQQQVVIVGGGVIGLLTAFNLASEVHSVVLLDRASVGQEASWAGGGIVSPLYPWRYSPAVTALAHWSQDFYPQLGERLFASTGVDPEVHVTGLYWLDLDDEAQALEWAEREGRPYTDAVYEVLDGLCLMPFGTVPADALSSAFDAAAWDARQVELAEHFDWLLFDVPQLPANAAGDAAGCGFGASSGDCCSGAGAGGVGSGGSTGRSGGGETRPDHHRNEPPDERPRRD